MAVDDPATLTQFANARCEDSLCSYLADGSDAEARLADVLSGGHLVYRYEAKARRVFAHTEYQATRALTPAEMETLREFTLGQWLDGVGAGFQQDYAAACGFWPEVDMPASLEARID